MKNSTFSAQVANNLLTLLQGYSKTIRLLLVMFLTLAASTAWAETVTYTVSSTSAVTKSGTAPDGSSATYKSTYTNAKCQLTANNSMTLTLSGYDGCKITGLTLSMKSNSSKGSGNMSMKIGNTTISSIATAKFNNNTWNGSWSTSYVNVTPSVTATTVGNGEKIVITIAATENSLYCQSFTITYETSGGGSTPDPITVTLDKSTLSLKEGENATLTATVTGSTNAVTWTSDASNIASVDNAGKVTAIAAGTANITAAIGDVKATCKVTVTAATTLDPGTGGEASTVTFTDEDLEGQGASGSGGDFTGATKDLIFMGGKGRGNTSYVQIYANNYLTFTPTNATITKIVLTATSGYIKTWSASEGTIEVSGDKATWTGSSTSTVTLTNTATAQARITQMDVTYTASGSDEPEPVIVKTLKSIAVTGMKTTYEQGDLFNFEGTCTATYSVTKDDVAQADETVEVTPTSVSTPDMNQVGTQTITVTYETVSTTYDITITENEVTAGTYDVLLNNVLWNVTAGQQAASVESMAGKSNDITFYTTKGSSQMYASATQTRFYASSKLVISVPAGYVIKSITFTEPTSDKKWEGSITVNTGTYTDGTKSWSGSAQEVQFSFAAQNRIANASITYEALDLTLPAAPTFTPAAGTYNAAQNVTISAEAGTTIHYTLDGTEPTTSSAKYTAPIQVSETKTIKAIAVKNEKVSQVASATYTINLPLTTMDQIFAKATAVGSTATSVEITFGNWVVSAVKEDGKTAFVTDGTKGFVIYEAGCGFKVGDILSGTAACKVLLYNGFAELTGLTSSTTGLTVRTGGTITTQELDAAGIAALTGVNTGSLIKINGICSSSDSKYYVADVQIYTSLYNFGTLEVGAEYNITGIYQPYNSTKEILPRSAADIEKVVGIPTATIAIADITMEIGQEKTIEATITPDAAQTKVQYAITAGSEYIDLDGTTITAVAAGTATITATIAEATGEYYGTTKTFNVTVKPQNIAVLSFTFDGGKADIENTLGMSQTGLDDDYNSAPKLKFNDAGDNVIIHFDSQAGEFSFLLKQNGQNAGTFTVYESANGEDYTPIWSGGNIGNTKSETITPTLAESSRYVKFEYTTKGEATNYALGSISIAKPDNRQEAGLAWDPETITLTVGDAFTAPTLSNPNSVSGITYESSNKDVATVTDAGVISLAGATGVATITATFDGNEDYKQAKVSCTITVKDLTTYTVTLNPNYPIGNTGTFIDTLGNTVSGNLEISLPAGTKSQAITKLYKSISLEGYIFEGWYEAAEGDAHRVNTGDISKDITFYAHWKVPYTVTFNAGTGNCTESSITETTAGGIELPAATLEDCGDWEFLGWATSSIAEETTTPASTLSSPYKPEGDITLYAVYKRVEGGGGESATATLTFDDTSRRTTFTTEQQVWTENGITLTNNKSNSTDNVADYSNPVRFYKSSEIIIEAPGNITQIDATTSGSDYTKALQNSVSGATANGNVVTITPSTPNNTYTINLTAGQVRLKSITVTYGGNASTSYYHSTPYCQTCENSITISKGAETNGTFTLDNSGEIETCETGVAVIVTPTPAAHYHIGGVTATTPTTGGAPTVTDNGNGTYTVTYVANSTGESTINVTFAEDAKATIKLYELGVLTTITTEYVGDKYTLPSTSSQSCGTKTLVGWSTVTFPETDTKPTENYVGIGSRITLAETQTYYAVFAQSSGGDGGSGDYERVTEALDNWAGDYLIAYNNETFANGSIGGEEGMGAKGNKQDLSSHINNNTIPANIGDLYNVTLVTVDGGYVLQTKDGNYNYYTSGTSNGLSATKSLETAKNYPIVIDFISSEDIELHITKEGERLKSVFSYNTLETGFFRFYKEGGQEPVYLYKKSGTAATYTGYTTSCAVITGIEVDNPRTTFDQYDAFEFGGTVYAVDENKNRIDVTTSATFSGYDMKKAGTDTVIVSYLSFETAYEITINDVDEWQITWNVSGATNTGLAPTHVIQGQAIGTLPQPKAIPDGCEGKKTFVGWTKSNTVNSDGTEITFITSSTVPTQNTTYYAVFATPSGNSGNGDYVKLTETPADLSGEYLIVYEAGNLAFNGGLTTLDAANNTISVAINGNTIKSTDDTDAAKFTITKNGVAYIITSKSNYHIGQTANANGLLSSTSISYTNTITITDGNADIIASGGAYLRYNKTSGDTRFRYYKSSTYTGQQPIALYKKSGSSASYTDYTTGCHDVTITYYGFTSGYTTNCDGSDLNVITTRVNSAHTIPSCADITDPTTLGRKFLNLWKDQNGKVHQPGETFIVTQDTTLYAQWKLETTGDIELPADKEDLATTDIVVTGGKTLTIPEGETITINSLTLKGGLIGDGKSGNYAMPSVWVPKGATLVRKNTTINLDLVVNSKSWYPFAVPFAATINANVEYLDPTLAAASEYGTHFAIKTYDGARRAKEGVDQTNNWVQLKRNEKLQPGVGYIISALTYPSKDTATIRIPMSVSNDWLANGEQFQIDTITRNAVEVVAHKGTAATEHQRHAGWNFVANPYLSNFAGSEASNEDGSFITGELLINKGDYYYDRDDDVPYVTIPAYDFSYYTAHKLSDIKLSPAYSFFVQVGDSGTMTFKTAGRQAAPASLAARSAEERPVKMDVDITLSDNHSSDQTGIIICDRYSEAYEIGRDLEKLFGSAYNLSVYTLMADNTPLAFQALAIRSNMQVIPVGYRAPEQGEYTFALNTNTSSIDLLNEQYEQLVLVDYQTGELTNLLIADYTFYSERTQADNRFALYAVPRQNAPTDLPNAIGQDKQAQKIIHNGHLYILRDGNVYNGNGQIVK